MSPLAYRATQRARRLLSKSLPGSRPHKAQVQRLAASIALTIYDRHKVGPYRWRVSHLRWYLEEYCSDESVEVKFNRWETICALSAALGKYGYWKFHLRGPWCNGHLEPLMRLPGAAEYSRPRLSQIERNTESERSARFGVAPKPSGGERQITPGVNSREASV